MHAQNWLRIDLMPLVPTSTACPWIGDNLKTASNAILISYEPQKSTQVEDLEYADLTCNVIWVLHTLGFFKNLNSYSEFWTYIGTSYANKKEKKKENKIERVKIEEKTTTFP